jgi:hypothetical protein
VYAVGSQSPPFVARFAQVAPQPVIAHTAAVSVVKGTVLVRAPGAKGFTPLTREASSIPIGSSVDATKGTVNMVTATGTGKKTQSGQFAGGAFLVKQGKGAQGLTELVMQGASFKGCPAAKGAAKRAERATGAAKKRTRRLFGNAHGHFRTRGRFSTATVRGTKWMMQDTCSGTLTKVTRGSVSVLDLVKHRTVLVKAGHSYLARPLAKKHG